jgi:hypothetical protein
MGQLGEQAPKPIERHVELADDDGQVAHADDERIVRHLAGFFGTDGRVFHELVSQRVHIDVHHVPAGDDRPFHVLVTSGMSALPMNVPARMVERAAWLHAELCIVLPESWPLSDEAFADERNYWPIRLLKRLARLPHDYATWLGLNHSVPNGDPPRPYAEGSTLSGTIVVPPFLFGGDFFSVAGSPPLHVFQLVPLTASEMAYKLEAGSEALMERLEARFPEIYGPIDPARASAM